MCLAQTQASPLILSPSMPHSHHSFHRSRTRTLLPLDIVCLSYHLLHASLSLYPSPRASFASNTHMHVYRSISQHIPRSTLTTPHRSTYLTSYVSPFSNKGRLIFLCSYVCLPQPHRPPHHSCMPPDPSLTRTCIDNKKPSPLLLILRACPPFV